MKIIEDVKKYGNHITQHLSYADIIQLAGYAAVEYCGGPSMNFRMGRKDVETETEASNALVIADHQHENSVMAKKFGMMQLSAVEYVALMGSYTVGFVSDDNLGKKGRWCMNPYVFDNTYFQEILLGHESKYLKTEADLKLLHDPELKSWCEAFAQDQNLFFEEYAKAHVKVSEHGQEEHLLSEIQPDHMIDGGYHETKGNHWAKGWVKDFDKEAFSEQA